MLTTAEIQELVATRMSQMDWTKEPKDLYAPVEYVLSLGGKRLRPLLTLMACNVFCEEVEGALMPALAVEVFHNFTLLHDDVMDKAPIRRGKPTVHNKWNENVAILSGDAMLVKAYEFFAKMPEDKLSRSLTVFTQTALEVCEGQQYDMEFEHRNDVTEKEYLKMIRLKTAVLLAGALKIGAIIGGANDQDASRLYDFGINIGLAFQLKDDLLDVYGDAKTFGKQIGGDILCNKKTFLLINALRYADLQQRNELNHWLAATDYNPQEKIAAVTALYDATGVKFLTEQRMDQYLDKALQLLDELHRSERTSQLASLAQRLMNRTL
jgi:geranylgeranyl diphosphate synthase type II